MVNASKEKKYSYSTNLFIFQSSLPPSLIVAFGRLQTTEDAMLMCGIENISEAFQHSVKDQVSLLIPLKKRGQGKPSPLLLHTGDGTTPELREKP